jgi:ATP-dependent Clp protease ATP-binding subunit ClpA
MFERFTPTARAVVVDAQAQTQRLRHRRVGTEHLLLALLRHGGGAASALREVGVTAEAVQAAIDRCLRTALGSLSEDDAAALKAIGIDLGEVWARIEASFGPVPPAVPPDEPRRRFGLRRSRKACGERPEGRRPFSPRSKKVLELSLREAIRLGHNYIAAEHILLGLLRENGGLAAKILADAGVDFAELRAHSEAALRAAA